MVNVNKLLYEIIWNGIPNIFGFKFSEITDIQ
jgi:hypothetical protein